MLESSHGVASLVPVSLTDVLEYRLANGLTVLSLYEPSSPVVTVMIWYRVGSAYEARGETGTAHFIEHMMFRGTSRFGEGEIDRRTSRCGGTSNAYTGYEFTAYFFVFSADRWSVALEMEADRMQGCLFEPEALEREREVILEEIAMEQDDPWEVLHWEIDRRVFGEGGYGHPVVGLAEDVARLERSRLQDFYRRYYRPDRAIIVLVGGHQPALALEKVEALFGGIRPSGREGVREGAGTVRLSPGPVYWETKRPGHIDRLLLAYPAPGLDDQDFPSFLVLDRLLSQGRLSLLHRRLLEDRELISTFSTDFEETKCSSLYYLHMELLKGIAPEQVAQEVQRVFEGVCEGRFSAEELKRARNQTVTSLLADLETGVDRAFQLGLYGTLVRWERLREVIERVSRLTMEDLQRAAWRFLGSGSKAVGLQRART